MSVQFPNIFRVDVNDGPAILPIHPIFQGDANANRIGCELYNGDTPVSPGGTCTGEAMLANGTTVALYGTVSGNQLYVDLLASCYVAEGPIRVSVRWTDGTTITTLVQVYGNVNITQGGSVIDPGTIISSVPALIASIDDAVDDLDAAIAAIPADYSAVLAAIAPNYADLTFPVSAEQLCWYSGVLYKAKQDISASETWTTAHWEVAEISAELSNLANIASKGAEAQAMIAPTEASTTASMAHPNGSYFILSGVLYQATADIASGDTIASTGVDANCQAVPGGLAGSVAGLNNSIQNIENLASEVTIDTPVSATGRYIASTTGAVGINSSFNITDYIDISAFDRIRYSRIQITGNTGAYGIAFYNASKTFLSGVINLREMPESGYAENTVDVPEGAVYFRATMWADTTTYGSMEAVGIFDYPLLNKFEELDQRFESTIDEIFALVAPTEASSTAASAHSFGSYFILSGVLYQATADIASGDTIASTGVNANCHAVPDGLAGSVAGLNNDIQNIKNLASEVTIDTPVSATGRYIASTTGAVGISSSFNITDYIDISAFDRIRYSRIQLTGTAYAYGIAFFDASKTFLSGVTSLKLKPENGYAENTVDVPEGAVYFRATMWADTDTYGSMEAVGIFDYPLLNKLAELDRKTTNLEQYSTGEIQYEMAYERDSIAYDFNGSSVAANIPVEARGGIVITSATENLMPSASSTSLTAAETLTLDAGTYTVSVYDGALTVTVGEEDTVVRFKQPYTFTLDSYDSITLTPVGTSCGYVQVEAKAFATPWNLGGESRDHSLLNITFPDGLTVDDRIGIGFTFVPFTNMLAATRNDTQLLYAVAGSNELSIHCKAQDVMRISFFVSIDGTEYGVTLPTQPIMRPLPGEYFGIYCTIEKGKGVTGWIWREGAAIRTASYGDVPTFGTVTKFQLGCKKTASLNMTANGIVGNLQVSTKPDPEAYFRRYCL